MSHPVHARITASELSAAGAAVVRVALQHASAAGQSLHNSKTISTNIAIEYCIRNLTPPHCFMKPATTHSHTSHISIEIPENLQAIDAFANICSNDLHELVRIKCLLELVSWPKERPTSSSSITCKPCVCVCVCVCM